MIQRIWRNWLNPENIRPRIFCNDISDILGISQNLAVDYNGTEFFLSLHILRLCSL